MTDEELIAEARRVGYLLRRCSGDVDRLAGALLAELADRLDGRAPEVIVRAWCKRCRHATMSVPCPECDGPACAGCGRCPPCDGDLPDEEE
jgi:hypothetical protein